MISLDDAAREITGAWKMAFNAKDWRQSLDRSLDGVFRSFYAAVFVVPLTAIFTMTAMRAAHRGTALAETIYATAPYGALFLVDLLTLALDWAISLAAIVAVARAFGGGKAAAETIAGYNWIQPLLAALRLPAVAAYGVTDSAGVGQAIALPALAMTVALTWGVIRRGFDASFGGATALLAVLLLTGGLADMSVGSIAHAIFAPQP